MNRHYTRYLIKKYEPLYQLSIRDGDTKPPYYSFYLFNFECGDGWFNIINNLSALLCEDWLRAKTHYDQVKDRLGKQRLDFALNDPYNTIVTQAEIDEAKRFMDEMYEKTPVASQVKEKYGTLRFYINGGTDEHYALISYAERMSAVTCEVCGDRGKRNHLGWIATRCREHEDD